MRLRSPQKLSPLLSRKGDIRGAQNRYRYAVLETLAFVSWFENTLITLLGIPGTIVQFLQLLGRFIIQSEFMHDFNFLVINLIDPHGDHRFCIAFRTIFTIYLTGH